MSKTTNGNRAPVVQSRMRHILSDLRFALRTFASSPVFTIVAVISLALGIGANTAIFTLLDQVLLRALPVQEPERLVQLSWKGSHYGSNWGSNSISYPMYRDFRDKNEVFSGMLSRFATSLSMSHNGQTERVAAELVSGTYYDVLAVHPAAGRLLTPQDDRLPGQGTVAVLSYDYWKTRFNRDPNIIGQTIRLNSYPMTVVGVAEEGFRGVDLGYNPQVMVPVTMKKWMTPNWDDLEQRRTKWLQVFARLKPGVSPDQAKASLQPYFKSIIGMEVQQEAFRNASKFTKDRFLQATVDVLPGGQGRPDFRRRLEKPLFVLMSIVGLVLLIACANVANLLLARAAARQKEIALRSALGAGTRRLIGQLLTEGVLLSVAGGVAGLLLAYWLNRFLLSALPQSTSPLAIAASPDLRVFAFTLAVSVFTGVVFSLAPAFQSTRIDLAPTLKDQAASVTSTGSNRFRKSLVVAQIALSLLLLIAAGLFIKSLRNLRQLDPGFRASRLITFAVNPALSGYQKPQVRSFFKNLQQALDRLPGVESASISRIRLLDGDRSDSTISVEGYQAKDGEDTNPWVNTVGPKYFATLGIPLVAGREFAPSDERSMILETFDFNKPGERERREAAEAKVQGAPKYAIVNESMAKRYFGNRSAVGRHFGFGGNPGTKLDIEIVGVVKDTKYSNMREEIPQQVFTTYIQSDFVNGMNVYVRTSLPVEQMFRAVRETVRGIDASMPVFDLRTIEEQIDRSLVIERMVATLSAVFGIVATMLAMVGLYGLMAYTVARRTREIGIRMALGAIRNHVVWMVMKEVVILTAVGVAIALPSAMLLTRLIQAQLFGMTPNDPATLAVATLALVGVAVLAGYIPAWRAARIDPIQALRHE